MKNKRKLLVITRSEWVNSNSTGNTMTNFFDKNEHFEINNLYFRDAPPKNEIVNKYFSISEFQILKKIINFKFNIGRSFEISSSRNEINEDNTKEKYLYSKLRRKSDKFSFEYIAREMLWKTNLWKNKNLANFLREEKPEVIFSTVFKFPYAHLVLRFIIKQTGAKLVLFHSDDYFYENSNEGILMRLVRKSEQKNILKTMEVADLNYCISQEQLINYKKYTKKPLKLLYKGADFEKNPVLKEIRKTSPIIITYIGSLQYGRWVTIGELSRAIKSINKKYDKEVIKLDVYSQYEPTEEELNHITQGGYTNYLGKLDSDSVPDKLSLSNIVLHVESFNKQEKERTKLSFSTKIVDCLNSGNCVLAIGDSKAASINYLKVNDAGIVINSVNEIESTLIELIKNPEEIIAYSHKSWELGKKNHDLNKIRSDLNMDLLSVLKEK